MRYLCAAIAVTITFLASATARGATVTWNGSAGTSWGSGGSWSNGTGPASGDSASFTDTGASTLPGDVTSLVNTSRTVAGLSFANSIGKFHTLDLNTATLTVAGNLNFNLDVNQNTTTTIRNGILNINSAFASVNVGRGAAQSSVAIADLSGLSSLGVTAQNVLVGTSTAGSATGTLTLSPSNNITAQLIQIGAANGSSDSGGTLHLGASNTIATLQLDIAKDNSTGTVDIVSGGTFNLGTPTQRTLLNIANQTTNTLATFTGQLNLGNAAVNLKLDSLIVAQKNGGSGGANGQLFGGGSGSVTIGDPSARGSVFVANTINGGSSTGTVDFKNLSTLSAYVNDFQVAIGTSGDATATVNLARTSTIDALNGVVIGNTGTANLTLGAVSTTLLTPSLTIGKNYSNATVTGPSGSTLNLGSPAQRTSLFIANAQTDTNGGYTGKLDLTGATLKAYIGDLIVGQRQGVGGGTTTGTILSPSGGSIDIGPAGNTANVIIGNALSGGAPAAASVDFSGLSSLTANLNNLSIGTSIAGSASGTLKLAATNTINAHTITVGSSGNSSNTLALGNSNTILVNQFTIAQEYASGAVTIPAGGTLNLGSPAQRTTLSIATAANTNTNATFVGTLDMTAATLVAYLDSVVIGNKNPFPGGEQGTLTISTKSSNYVEANSIFLGGTQSTGTLNFGGGQFFAGSIAAGAGTANFNWTGGTLSVGTFGTPTIPFNLNNTTAGTLAPGSAANAIGTTTINGNYIQASSATTAIQIAGVSSGTGNDQLAISGSATLAGTLNLSLTNGFVPSVGQNMLIATYASRSGTYGFVAPPAMPQNVAFQLDYTTNAQQLMMRTVAPIAQTWTQTAASATWGVAGNWSGGTVPGTAGNLTVSNSAANAQTITVAASTTVHRVSLQGASPSAPLNLEVPQGIRLGIANQLIVGTNSSLTGAGQVLGSVVIAGGSVAPGPSTATLSVAGDLTALSNATLLLDLSGNGATQHDLIDVLDNLAVAGDLKVSTLNGYSPQMGDTFDLLNFASASGQFDHLILPPLSPGLQWDTSALLTSGQIAVAVPEPATAFGAIALACAALARRSSRRQQRRQSRTTWRS